MLVSGQAEAYSLQMSRNGDPLRWLAPQISFDLYLAGSTTMSAWDAEQAVIRGTTEWQGHAPVSFWFVSHHEPTAHPAIPDEANIVRWVNDRDDPFFDPAALATTVVSYRAVDGVILDTDIVINAVNFRWGDGSRDCHGTHDLQNVIAHEAGHALGLGHSPEHTDATMFPRSPACETRKRDLSDDDIAAIHVLYGGESERSAGEQTTTDPSLPLACSSRSGGFGTFALLLVAALLIGKRRRLAATLGAVAVLSSTSPAQATTMNALTMTELAERADMAVRGLVVYQAPVAIGGRIFTDSYVVASDCWSGNCSPIVVVRQRGGEIDGVGQRVSGAAEFVVGRQVVLFLRRVSELATPLGMAQGVFHIDSAGYLSRDLSGMSLVGAPITQSRWHWSTLRTFASAVRAQMSKRIGSQR